MLCAAHATVGVILEEDPGLRNRANEMAEDGALPEVCDAAHWSGQHVGHYPSLARTHSWVSGPVDGEDHHCWSRQRNHPVTMCGLVALEEIRPACDARAHALLSGQRSLQRDNLTARQPLSDNQNPSSAA